MLKYRVVLIMDCDAPDCNTSARFEDHYKSDVAAGALRAGWVSGLMVRGQYCPVHAHLAVIADPADGEG